MEMEMEMEMGDDGEKSNATGTAGGTPNENDRPFASQGEVQSSSSLPPSSSSSLPPSSSPFNVNAHAATATSMDLELAVDKEGCPFPSDHKNVNTSDGGNSNSDGNGTCTRTRTGKESDREEREIERDTDTKVEKEMEMNPELESESESQAEVKKEAETSEQEHALVNGDGDGDEQEEDDENKDEEDKKLPAIASTNADGNATADNVKPDVGVGVEMDVNLDDVFPFSILRDDYFENPNSSSEVNIHKTNGDDLNHEREHENTTEEEEDLDRKMPSVSMTKKEEEDMEQELQQNDQKERAEMKRSLKLEVEQGSEDFLPKMMPSLKSTERVSRAKAAGVAKAATGTGVGTGTVAKAAVKAPPQSRPESQPPPLSSEFESICESEFTSGGYVPLFDHIHYLREAENTPGNGVGANGDGDGSVEHETNEENRARRSGKSKSSSSSSKRNRHRSNRDRQRPRRRGQFGKKHSSSENRDRDRDRDGRKSKSKSDPNDPNAPYRSNHDDDNDPTHTTLHHHNHNHHPFPYPHSYPYPQCRYKYIPPSKLTREEIEQLDGYNITSLLHDLPMDAMHCVSTFWTVKDLNVFALVNRHTSVISQAIVRKVKMHAFKCAVEVATTWNRGEHADAKELAALYVHCGVPIYPAPLGHAYHTLYWRMAVEAKSMRDKDTDDDDDTDGGGDGDDNDDNSNGNGNGGRNNGLDFDNNDMDNDDASTSNHQRRRSSMFRMSGLSHRGSLMSSVGGQLGRLSMFKPIEMRNGSMDRFYLERADARNAGNYWHASLTYLEEKGLFWKSKVCGIPTQWTREQRMSRTPTFNIRPPPPPIADTFGFLGFMDEEEDFPNLAEQNRVIGIGENVAIGPGDIEFGHIPEIAAMRESDANFSTNSNSRSRQSSRLEDIHSLNEQEEEFRRRQSSMMSSLSNHNNNNCKRSSYRTREEEEEQNTKIVLHCHKHLVDRHLQGLPAISDELGNMNAEPLQLGADFFHPVLNRSYPFKCNFGTFGKSGKGNNGFGGGGGGDYGDDGDDHRSGHGRSRHASRSSNTGHSHSHGRYSQRRASSASTSTVAHRRESTNTASTTATPRRPLIVRSSGARPPSRRSERGAPAAAAATAGEGLDSSSSRARGRDRDRDRDRSTSMLSMLTAASYGYPPRDDDDCNQQHQYLDHYVIADLDLHLYDSTSGEDYDMARRRKSCKQYITSTTKFIPKVSYRDVTTIVSNYERKLHSLLQRGDYAGYNECLLDFWDEFFSLTSHVHFYDQHTPVPRMSKLHHFLTKPCPKAFGTMQCEIERIRVKYRTKGMMTGRYYSTYEYRLFIKDRRQDVVQSQGTHPRMDTMLMAAKYRGKHYSGPNGLAPVTNGKKGVNHYFLYMPHQDDMDEHYELVNQKDDKDKDKDASGKKKKKKKNGKDDNDDEEEEDGVRRYRQEVPAAGSILELCRLQTNHMGTEFQISSPCVLKYNNGSGSGSGSSVSHSRDNNDHDAAENDNGNDRTGDETEGDASSSTSQPRSFKFNPFQKRQNRKNSKGGGDGNTNSNSNSSTNKGNKKNKNSNSRVAARISPWSKKMSLVSHPHKASARNSKGEIQPNFVEEREIGAITYTANVLGNRPRIMNVCIPKVSSETERPIAADDAWTKKPGVDGTMLSKLKDIQHVFNTNPEDDPHHQHNQHRHQQQQRINNNNNPAEADDANQDDYGLTSLQNRPPWWNNDLGAFVLNFGGRVSVASVKNFQLCDRDDHDNIMLQFGRIEGRHSFTMDFSFPLSPVQAFAISISSLQSKLSFA